MSGTLASQTPAPATPASIDRLTPGAVFADRYEVLALLGHGGMGAVFRVHDRELGEDVALKVLKPEIAAVEGALDRFRREVKLARRVTHPNVARTFDMGSFEGTRFLTMELIAGEPLSKRITHARREARLPLADVLRIAAEITRGLAAAHAVGVVHRDLKPENVMIAETSRMPPRASLQPPSTAPRIAPNERMVVMDFGIARLAEHVAAGRQTSMQTIGTAIGTPAYMAPEQLEGRELDGRADVYALGVVLFELLTGAMPFEGDTVYAIAAARLHEAAPDPRTKDQSIPDPVAQLVMDALARKREHRPDAQTLLQRIDTLRGAGSDDGERPARPMIPEIDFDRLSALGPRTIAVLPLDGAHGEAQRAAVDLSAAIVDALSGARGVKIVGASTVRAALSTSPASVDPAAVGRAVHADLVVGGDVRVSKENARVHVRLVDVGCNVQTWAERIDGSLADPFDLEDRVVAEVTTAVRARTGEIGGLAGPTDPRVRGLWERARASYVKFGPPFIEEAVNLLREAQAITPNDPWVLSALGAALTRKWLLNAATARELIAEAEEITLRALAIDPSIGDTYNTIGIMRLQHGETRAAVRAFREAIARTPLHAEAHSYLGRLLGESGYVEEAMRRFDLAIRLDTMALVSHFEKARTYALLGDRAAANVAVERAITLGGAMTGIISQARFVMWFVDRPLAARLVENVENAGLRAHFGGSRILPMLEAFAQDRPMAEIVDLFHKFVDMSTASPRQRSFFYQLATEFAAASGELEEAFAALEKSAALPLIDLLWMDKCPVLEKMRDDPRFVRARAIVAARVAEIWA